MVIKKRIRTFSILTLIVLLNACNSMNQLRDEAYAPTPPIKPPPRAEINGSIYHAATNRFLFEDIKARRVGDMITVILEEQTNASKSAKTATSKKSETEVPAPLLFGRTATRDGVETLQTNFDSEIDFEGEGDTSQSNSLTGSITVTIVDVLSNGNLKIRGEKLLTLNHGSEVIRISGLVRSIDITTQNTIRSTQIAAAEITYSGNGMIANSNKPGWFTKFFNIIWPF